MEKLGLIKSGTVEEQFTMFLADPRVGTESPSEGKKKDDNERTFKNF